MHHTLNRTQQPGQAARAGRHTLQGVPGLSLRCQAAQSTPGAPVATLNPLLVAAAGALFKFKPFFDVAQKKARETIKKRAEAIGIDWDADMAKRRQQDWDALMKETVNPAVTYPDYYTQPFHAYSQGNLCWDAALEVTNAAKSVHALVMDPENKKLDPEGDTRMRASFQREARANMEKLGGSPAAIKNVVDLGCATGLSSLAVLDAFPGSRVTGVDLSPHFLTVAKYEQRERQAATGVQEPLEFMHGNAECTGLPSGQYDMVTLCLVAHELPRAASKAIFKEAFRLLRPGGFLTFMDMDPHAATFRRVMGNPMAYTAFKSTEPWLEEYMSLDLHGAMREAGFAATAQTLCTSRHRAVTALKPSL